MLALDEKQLTRLDESLLHLVDLRIDLEAWARDDAEGFVQHALVDAGRLDPIFTDEAFDTLHRLTRGSPRHVVRLADFALLAGAGIGAQQIDGDMVHAAFDEIAFKPAVAIA